MPRRRFRRQFIWLPLLLALLTVLGLTVAAVALHYVEADLVASSGETLTLAAMDIADKLDLLLFERYIDINRIAETLPLYEGESEKMRAYLAAVQKAYPIYIWIGVTDAQGRIVVATNPASVGQDRSARPWFQAVRNGAPVHARDAEPSEDSSGIMAVAFTAPLRGADGGFRGAVTTRVELQVLEDVFIRTARALEQHQDLSSKVEWQFLTRNGNVLMDSFLRQEGRVNLKDLGLPSALLSLDSGSGYVEEVHVRRKVPVITGYAKTGGYGRFKGFEWSVLVRTDRHDVLAPTRAILWKLGVAGAMIWIPLFGLLIWSTWRLRREWIRAGESESLARESEQRFRKTFDDAPIGMSISGRDYRLTRVNQAFSDMLGYGKDELIGKTFVDITHPEDRSVGVKESDRLWAGTIQSFQLEKRYLRKDQSVVLVHLTVTGIHGEKGEHLYNLAMIEDITEKRRTEGRQAAQVAVSLVLAGSDSLDAAAPRVLQAVCDTMGWELGMIWQAEQDDKVLRCQTLWQVPALQAEEFVAMSRAMTFERGVGLPGRVWASGEPAWISDVVRDSNFPRASDAAKSGLHGAFGFPIKRRERVLGVIEFYSREIRQMDHTMLTMMADVGLKIGSFVERIQAQEAAAASEERFRMAIDSASDAILYLDKNDVVVWANHQAAVITGQSIESLVGDSLMGAFSTQPLAKAQLASIGLGRPVPPWVEFEVFLRDGTSRWLEVTISHVRRGEEVAGWLLVARDRTENRQIERQLRQSEKMASLGLLLDGVAHELNNPLFVISGYAQLAAEKAKGKRYDGLADDVAAIDGAAKRATDIVQRTLAVARRAKGGGEACEINRVMQETLDLVAQDLTEGKVVLYRKFQSDLPPVLANPHELKQVFLNLITNAHRAMTTVEGESILTVSTGLVPDQPRSWVELRVADNGPGLTPELQARIFEPFSTAQQGSQGTSLSLAICHRIVTDLGGTLVVESRIGHGATFIVRLPAAEAAGP